MPSLSNIKVNALKQQGKYANNVNSSYINNNESYKATGNVDLVHLLWTCSNKYLIGRVEVSVSLVNSVSSIDLCKYYWDKKVKLWFAFAKISSNIADMSKMKSFRDFKVSIDYRVNSSIGFYRLL